MFQLSAFFGAGRQLVEFCFRAAADSAQNDFHPADWVIKGSLSLLYETDRLPCAARMNIG
jgi:hypothetical protein